MTHLFLEFLERHSIPVVGLLCIAFLIWITSEIGETKSQIDTAVKDLDEIRAHVLRINECCKECAQ